MSDHDMFYYYKIKIKQISCNTYSLSEVCLILTIRIDKFVIPLSVRTLLSSSVKLTTRPPRLPLYDLMLTITLMMFFLGTTGVGVAIGAAQNV